MNERIRQLEIQAVFHNEEEDTWEFDREKFAQLIIKECVDVAAKYDEPKMSGSSGPGLTIGGMISEHFGVEA